MINYDGWKLESPYKAEQKNNDFFMNKKVVEFDNVFFYHNNNTLSLTDAINIMDDIDNVNHNRTFVIQLYIKVFDSWTSINDFQRMYEFFIN